MSEGTCAAAPVIEVRDLSLMVQPSTGCFVRMFYRWPVTTAEGLLAIALAWPVLGKHQGEILHYRHAFNRSVKA